jgi:hypothetical protein
MSNDTSQDADWVPWIVVVFLAVPLLYVGSYFLTVRPAVLTVRFSPNGALIVSQPDYHGLPAGIFAPLNQLDRTFLRPQMWNLVRVWSIKNQMGRSQTGCQDRQIFLQTKRPLKPPPAFSSVRRTKPLKSRASI